MPSDAEPEVREREQLFHDALADSLNTGNKLAPRPLDELEQAMFERLGPLTGQDVLDFGCRVGDLTLHALRRGATVTAIDLSPRMTEITCQRVAATGSGRCRAVVAPVEASGLPAGSFDVVLGRWIIHHVDVEAAAHELVRLLRPGGMAVLIETSSLNPLLRFARDHLVGRFGIPRFRTVDEHPQNKADYATLLRAFKTLRVDMPFIYFFVIGVRHLPYRLQRPAVKATARWLDRQVWRWFPAFRRYSYWVLIEGHTCSSATSRKSRHRQPHRRRSSAIVRRKRSQDGTQLAWSWAAVHILHPVSKEPTCSVVVPSYRRPLHLRRCLSALLEQDVLPAEIIVVARVDDPETQAVVTEVQRSTDILSLATVTHTGVVAAMEIGVRQAAADVVAFTDDDARPRRDWLARVTAAFQEESRIAGVGGRDHLRNDSAVTASRTVGRVAWFGRVVGNHHLGVGPRRTVTVLKGVNSAYRRDVLEQVGFDHRLRGCGAQVHWEMALGLAITRRGWSLLYDPAIMVDHDEAPRIDGQRLGALNAEEAAVADAAYNEALVLTEHLSGPRKLAYLLWSSVVGHRASPGLVQAVRFTPKLGRHSWRSWSVARRARREARRRAGMDRPRRR